jgi:hypothetical protein
VNATADYDAPRRVLLDESDADSLQLLAGRGAATRCGVVEVDETDLNEALELPGADLSHLQLDDDPTVPLVPKRPWEFTCSRCFLITPHSRLADTAEGRQICRDCA